MNPINRGGGAALRAGYQVALDSGAEIIVTLDADGQHLPEEIPNLVKPILDGEVDLVNGSRILGSFEPESRISVSLVNVTLDARDESFSILAMRRTLLQQATTRPAMVSILRLPWLRSEARQPFPPIPKQN